MIFRTVWANKTFWSRYIKVTIWICAHHQWTFIRWVLVISFLHDKYAQEITERDSLYSPYNQLELIHIFAGWWKNKIDNYPYSDISLQSIKWNYLYSYKPIYNVKSDYKIKWIKFYLHAISNWTMTWNNQLHSSA